MLANQSASHNLWPTFCFSNLLSKRTIMSCVVRCAKSSDWSIVFLKLCRLCCWLLDFIFYQHYLPLYVLKYRYRSKCWCRNIVIAAYWQHCQKGLPPCQKRGPTLVTLTKPASFAGVISKIRCYWKILCAVARTEEMKSTCEGDWESTVHRSVLRRQTEACDAWGQLGCYW